jgi:hypothetical protein
MCSQRLDRDRSEGTDEPLPRSARQLDLPYRIPVDSIPDHGLPEHARDDREGLVNRRNARAVPREIRFQPRDHSRRYLPHPIAPEPLPNMPLPDPRVTVPRVVRERWHRIVPPPPLHELRDRFATAIEIERPAELPCPPNGKLEPLRVRLQGERARSVPAVLAPADFPLSSIAPLLHRRPVSISRRASREPVSAEAAT